MQTLLQVVGFSLIFITLFAYLITVLDYRFRDIFKHRLVTTLIIGIMFIELSKPV